MLYEETYKPRVSDSDRMESADQTPYRQQGRASYYYMGTR